MKVVALTGATGFIGTHVARAALAAGWTVRVLIRPGEVHALPPEVAIEPWDLAGNDDPVRFLLGVDAVCHMAALIPSNYSDPALAEDCMRVNALGTLKLLDAVQRAGVPRFVQFSSGNAYSQGCDLARPVSEDTPIFPSVRATYYLASKLAAELYVDYWGRTKRLDTCILRLASVYGPGMSRKGLLPYLARQLRAGHPVTLPNGGTYGTDLVHVGDVARATIVALSAEASGPINIGSGNRTTAREMAETLARLLGQNPALIVEDPISVDTDLGFHPLDITRAQRLLGFVPTVLTDGLRDYLTSLEEATMPSAR